MILQCSKNPVTPLCSVTNRSKLEEHESFSLHTARIYAETTTYRALPCTSGEQASDHRVGSKVRHILEECGLGELRLERSPVGTRVSRSVSARREHLSEKLEQLDVLRFVFSHHTFPFP